MNIKEIKNKIKQCLEKLYQNDSLLFVENNNKGLCERCIVFRFALYLQKKFPNYFIDCDFNSAIANGRNITCKPITNPDGTTTGRFIDIIIHKRTSVRFNDFICFEIKKWNNKSRESTEKDKNNLKGLTSEYGYKYGFYLILGRTKEKTKWIVFRNGAPLNDLESIFNE
jgi:hypothetical protein